jgi:hypothetical protein
VQEGRVFGATLRVNSHNRNEVIWDVWYLVSGRLGIALTVRSAHGCSMFQESCFPPFWAELKLQDTCFAHLLLLEMVTWCSSICAGICYHWWDTPWHTYWRICCSKSSSKFVQFTRIIGKIVCLKFLPPLQSIFVWAHISASNEFGLKCVFVLYEHFYLLPSPAFFPNLSVIDKEVLW